MNASKIFKRNDINITSPFGNRIDPINGAKDFHDGVDYGTKGQKLPQYGLAKGVVLSCGKDGTGGIYANVHYPTLGDHVGVYYHLDRLAVKTGQAVDANTIIGYTGTTGRSTGIHLHFGWCKRSEIIKPWKTRAWENFEMYSFTVESPTQQPKPQPSKLVAGQKVTLTNAPIYPTALNIMPTKRVSGTYFLYDGIDNHGRYRITNHPSRVNKAPIGANVTGWINSGNVK